MLLQSVPKVIIDLQIEPELWSGAKNISKVKCYGFCDASFVLLKENWSQTGEMKHVEGRDLSGKPRFVPRSAGCMRGKLSIYPVDKIHQYDMKNLLDTTGVIR